MYVDKGTVLPQNERVRIEACVNCELELPLIRVENTEQVEVWACSYCGCVYRGLIDPGANEDLRRNVRRVEYSADA